LSLYISLAGIGRATDYLKQEVGAPQAAVEAHPAGAAVVQALL